VYSVVNRNPRIAATFQEFFRLLEILLLARLKTHGVMQNEKRILLRHEFIVDFAYATTLGRYGLRLRSSREGALIGRTHCSDAKCVVNQ
jgi:hypothetical protein